MTATARNVIEADWEYIDLLLDNGEVAARGNLACIDTATGNIKAGQALTTLIPFGHFTEDLIGDGVQLVNIRLFSEVKAYWWDNDVGTPADAGDRGSECYIFDSSTVTMDSTGASKAGRVLDVDTLKGVLVLSALSNTGATGASQATDSHAADRTALAAIPAANRSNGKRVLVDTDGSMWRFSASSTATDTTQNLVVTPAVGTGRWIRDDESFTLSIPITFATVDAAAIFTVPAGFVLKLAAAPYWDVATGFTGGTNSSIGLSSSRTGYSTKGDLISATLAAALTAGVRPGVIGDKVDSFAEMQALFFEAAQTIRHDRIVDAFTAGIANVRVPVLVCTSPADA